MKKYILKIIFGLFLINSSFLFSSNQSDNQDENDIIHLDDIILEFPIHQDDLKNYLKLLQKSLELHHNYDLNKKNKDGLTALYLAVNYNAINVVKYLIQAGADMLIKYENDQTILHQAVCHNNELTVKTLIIIYSKKKHQQKKFF